MLIISASQLLAMQAARSAQTRDQAVARLRLRFPERTQDTQLLAQWVEQGLARADLLRIHPPEAQLRFLLLRYEHGDAFELEPWARPLHSADPDEGRRLDAAEALAARGR